MIRRIVIIAILSAFLVAPALAQRPNAARQAERQQQPLKKALKQGKRKTAERAQQKANGADVQQAQRLQRALNLTDTQAQQVRGLLATRDQELAQLKATGKGQRKDGAQAIQERFQTGLRALLTPDQAQRFDSKRNGRKAQTR